jgi:protease I
LNACRQIKSQSISNLEKTNLFRQLFLYLILGVFYMEQNLSGKRIAILVTDGFEQVELTGPQKALQQAGATTVIVSSKAGQVQGFHHDAKGDSFTVDATFDDAQPEEFDAVLLPGGVMNADQIRMVPEAQAFVQAIDEQHKPLAVICHGAWLLISAGLVEGRTMTSWPSLEDDILNAGGTWVDQEAVVDQNWVSSRKPDDIAVFNTHLINLLGKSHQGNAIHRTKTGATTAA